MSRPQYDRSRDYYAEPYRHMESSTMTNRSDHKITLPPARDLIAEFPTISGHHQDYHPRYNYPPPHPPEQIGPYPESSSYTTLPRVRSPETSTYHDRSSHASRPEYRYPPPPVQQSQPSFDPPPTAEAESRPPEGRMGPPNSHDRHYPTPSRPRSDQATPRKADNCRPAKPGRSTRSAMIQRQSTFHATPPSITFGPVNPVPHKIAPVLNLLGPDKSAAVEEVRFRISVRQQPHAARACGSGERDRRNIDPPPVVQLHVEGNGLTKEDLRKYLSWDGYVMNCWIYDESGEHEASKMPAEYHYQRRLTGSQVAAPFFGRDEHGIEGCFFAFSDLSVRTLGVYRLKFNMIMLDITQPGKSRHFPNLAEVISESFTVYTAKEFPGISESSMLVRALRSQGCIISIKKGNERRRKGGNQYDDDFDSED